MIRKILIANRGEIAVRVMRTARKLGIRSVAVYSSVDKDSLHVSFADEAWCIGEVELHETYLNIPKIIDVAVRSGCDAIHPGYGFLAENPLFPEACAKAGIIFVGPSGDIMRKMGNKIAARAFAKKINIPITEGLTGNKTELLKVKERIAFPVLLKAAAGGGGKGMRIVYDEKDLEEAIDSTSRQALAYFGDETVYIEKFIEDPRHIEFQVMGDHFGNVVHLFERECSIQRRYQKIIEESPSPTLTPEVREEMGKAAVRIAREIGYTNAGTIEFLVDKALNFYFLEMNTRIQVEHPVTELVTGYDLVEEQIRIAEGLPLRIRQEDVRQNGHAIECRIYAEDPANDFRPSPGKMTLYLEPEMPGIRIDTGITAKTEIRSNFDPMIAKLIIWGAGREDARVKMINTLQGYNIHGIETNITYLTQLLKKQEFLDNTISTKFCDAHTADIVQEINAEKTLVPAFLPLTGYLLADLQIKTNNINPSVWNEIGYWRNQMRITIQTEDGDKTVSILRSADPDYEMEIGDEIFQVRKTASSGSKTSFVIDGNSFSVFLSEDDRDQAFLSLCGHIFRLKRQDVLTDSITAAGPETMAEGEHHILAPMPGKVIRVSVSEGDEVEKGALLLILEAMKMENRVVAPGRARIAKINVKENDRIESSMTLMVLERIEDGG